MPELLIEVAASSSALDLNAKKNAYQRNRVQEYLVLQVYEQKSSWFEWHDGSYREIQADDDGILRSQVFPGLWLDSKKFWEGDLAGVLTVLQQGIASTAHQTFIKRLQAHL